jgi:hypothetical protein
LTEIGIDSFTATMTDPSTGFDPPSSGLDGRSSCRDRGRRSCGTRCNWMPASTTVKNSWMAHLFRLAAGTKSSQRSHARSSHGVCRAPSPGCRTVQTHADRVLTVQSRLRGCIERSRVRRCDFTADTRMCNVWSSRYFRATKNRRLIGTGQWRTHSRRPLVPNFATPDDR